MTGTALTAVAAKGEDRRGDRYRSARFAANPFGLFDVRG